MNDKNAETGEVKLTEDVFKTLNVLFGEPLILGAVVKFFTGEEIEGDERVIGTKVSAMRYPDVIIETTHRKFCVEVKLGASFHKDQLESYCAEHGAENVKALGVPHATPKAVSDAGVDYKNWSDFRQMLLNLREQVGENLVHGLTEAADAIKHQVGIFDSFSEAPNQEQIEAVRQANIAAALFFRALKGWAIAQLPQQKISARLQRGRHTPVVDHWFGLHLQEGLGSALVDLRLGIPWTVCVGVRLPKGKSPDYYDSVREAAEKRFPRTKYKYESTRVCGLTKGISMLDGAQVSDEEESGSEFSALVFEFHFQPEQSQALETCTRLIEGLDMDLRKKSVTWSKLIRGPRRQSRSSKVAS